MSDDMACDEANFTEVWLELVDCNLTEQDPTSPSVDRFPSPCVILKAIRAEVAWIWLATRLDNLPKIMSRPCSSQHYSYKSVRLTIYS